MEVGRRHNLPVIEDCSQSHAAVLDGKYERENRFLLDAEVHRAGKVVGRADALNDVVISRGIITRTIRLEPGKIYVQPNGYKIEMVKHPGAPSWRIVGTDPEGTFCHKPSTVSGGGKSEISKSLNDAVIYRPLFVDDLNKDLDQVQAIFDKDYTQRFKAGCEGEDRDAGRKPLSPERSLGSVIKLLTPTSAYTDEFNEWLAAIPPRILALVYLIKRFYRTEWGDRWREHLSVDEVDGAPAHELKLDGRNIVASYLRVGFDRDGKWRTFKLRQDYIATEKVQMEDDITTSIVVPPERISDCGPAQDATHSVKLTHNCEYRLFQRPDDAIHPGFDKQTELDMSRMVLVQNWPGALMR